MRSRYQAIPVTKTGAISRTGLYKDTTGETTLRLAIPTLTWFQNLFLWPCWPTAPPWHWPKVTLLLSRKYTNRWFVLQKKVRVSCKRKRKQTTQARSSSMWNASPTVTMPRCSASRKTNSAIALFPMATKWPSRHVIANSASVTLKSTRLRRSSIAMVAQSIVSIALKCPAFTTCTFFHHDSSKWNLRA